jgi:hypothetical protein
MAGSFNRSPKLDCQLGILIAVVVTASAVGTGLLISDLRSAMDELARKTCEQDRSIDRPFWSNLRPDEAESKPWRCTRTGKIGAYR